MAKAKKGSEFRPQRVADKLMIIDSEVSEKMNLESSDPIRDDFATAKKYWNSLAKAIKAERVPKKLTRKVFDILEEENYHPLNEFLELNGYYGEDKKKHREEMPITFTKFMKENKMSKKSKTEVPSCDELADKHIARRKAAAQRAAAGPKKKAPIVQRMASGVEKTIETAIKYNASKGEVDVPDFKKWVKKGIDWVAEGKKLLSGTFSDAEIKKFEDTMSGRLDEISEKTNSKGKPGEKKAVVVESSRTAGKTEIDFEEDSPNSLFVIYRTDKYAKANGKEFEAKGYLVLDKANNKLTFGIDEAFDSDTEDARIWNKHWDSIEKEIIKAYKENPDSDIQMMADGGTIDSDTERDEIYAGLKKQYAKIVEEEVGFPDEFRATGTMHENNFGGISIILNNSGDAGVVWRDWAGKAVDEELSLVQVDNWWNLDTKGVDEPEFPESDDDEVDDFGFIYKNQFYLLSDFMRTRFKEGGAIVSSGTEITFERQGRNTIYVNYQTNKYAGDGVELLEVTGHLNYSDRSGNWEFEQDETFDANSPEESVYDMNWEDIHAEIIKAFENTPENEIKEFGNGGTVGRMGEMPQYYNENGKPVTIKDFREYAFLILGWSDSRIKTAFETIKRYQLRRTNPDKKFVLGMIKKGKRKFNIPVLTVELKPRPAGYEGQVPAYKMNEYFTVSDGKDLHKELVDMFGTEIYALVTQTMASGGVIKHSYKKYAAGKKDYVEFLNELGIPRDDLKSEGGRIPDSAKYGEWVRRNDQIAFNLGYNEWLREKR